MTARGYSRCCREPAETDTMAGSGSVRRLLVALAIACSALAQLAPARAATSLPRAPGWADVPAHFWARTAIHVVAGTHPWMEDFGPTRFKPSAPETRARFAPALVLAFGSGPR